MSDLSIQLPDALVDAVAHRVLELLQTQRSATASPWLDVAEAADYLRCSRQRIYDLSSQGRLMPARDGKRLLFHRDELDSYLTARAAA